MIRTNKTSRQAVKGIHMLTKVTADFSVLVTKGLACTTE